MELRWNHQSVTEITIFSGAKKGLASKSAFVLHLEVPEVGIGLRLRSGAKAQKRLVESRELSRTKGSATIGAWGRGRGRDRKVTLRMIGK